VSGVSVLTLNKGRRPHLDNLLAGLARGAPPDECVVVEMGGDESPLPALPFPVRRVMLPAEGLALAGARNAARRAATGETLIFLDVDCIPSRTLVTGLAEAARARDGLICCEILYLPAGAAEGAWTEAGLEALGQTHPVRSFPAEGLAEIDNAGLFWSLAFAVRAASFDRIGGFDEDFSGYGGEDTDLAFRAAAAGLPLLFAGGMRAFHQHHASCDPPLQHFSDIVRNSRRFHARHGFWPMSGWLDAFAGLGLIAPDRARDLTVLRAPTPEEIAAARLAPERVF